MKNTFQKLSLWRLIIVVISLCFTTNLYAQSPTASFTYDDMTTQGGVSISTNAITGKKASTNFCKDGGTQIKADLISLDQSAGTSPDTKHILIESSSDITSISLDASYNSSGSAKNIAIACWKDGNSDISSPDYIYTVGILGYDRDCSAALVTQAIGEGVRTIRIYRKVKFSGTDYGAGTTTNFKEIQVFAGAPCADSKPTISGALSPCGSTTTLS
ncbi:MAG: hypothetical protein IKP63_01185, partial [Paludibacteraceae bacterium]|nr:hypothetical protein [Paludibacteraceae bacterium]